MDSHLHLIDALVELFVRFGNLIVAGIVAIELWLRASLRQFGFPPSVQTAILIGVAVVLVVGALRLFGGLIRLAVVVLVLALVAHILLPVIRP